MGNKKRLKYLTEQLVEVTAFLVDTFYRVRESGEKEDFYQVVRPYANKVKEINEEWKEIASSWVQKDKPLYLHPSQIVSASNHLEVISIQAFFPDTSKKRFLDAAKSIQFILQTVLNELIESD